MKVEYLIRDRDSKYVSGFDDVFAAINYRVDPTAPRAPTQNTFIERWVKAIRVECLNFFIGFGRKHLDHLVDACVHFYNTTRPHQAKANRPLTGHWPDEDEPMANEEEILCHESLGGILRHYERVAA